MSDHITSSGPFMGDESYIDRQQFKETICKIHDMGIHETGC